MRVGGYQDLLGTLDAVRGLLRCQLKSTVVHWGLHLVGRGRETWIITQDVMSLTVYVRGPILLKENLH